MRSDRGTNFTGAERELKSALEEIDHQRLQEISSREFNADWPIRWKWNPPAVSHMGVDGNDRSTQLDKFYPP